MYFEKFPEMFDGIERKYILKNIPLKNVGEHFSIILLFSVKISTSYF